MENQELKTEIKDLLNQIAIKLKDVKSPEVDEEDSDYGFANIPVDFKSSYEKGNPNFLPSVKMVVEAVLSDLERNPEYTSDSEKMARAYYSSFCNG